MFPLPENKKDNSPLSQEPRNEDREWFYHQLPQYGKFTGVCWLLCSEPEPAAQLPLKTIELLSNGTVLGEAPLPKQFSMVYTTLSPINLTLSMSSWVPTI